MRACRRGRTPGMWVRIGVVALYLAVFGCNGLFDAAVGAVKVVGAITRAVAEQNRRNREAAAIERDHYRALHTRWPDYDAELIQPHVPLGYGGDVPEGHFRTERGSGLDAPAPAPR